MPSAGWNMALSHGLAGMGGAAAGAAAVGGYVYLRGVAESYSGRDRWGWRDAVDGGGIYD